MVTCSFVADDRCLGRNREWQMLCYHAAEVLTDWLVVLATRIETYLFLSNSQLCFMNNTLTIQDVQGSLHGNHSKAQSITTQLRHFTTLLTLLFIFLKHDYTVPVGMPAQK